MKKKLGILKRISSLLMTLVIVVSMITAMPLNTGAAQITKTEKSYDIAVVFDNSGSMYLDGSKAWCRAKYAMEIFASMMSYENGDKLTIFPMWGVTTDENSKGSGSYSAIKIGSKKDIDKISNLYTVEPLGTPFAPINEAHSYLKKSKADEKWLIVLTDGQFTEIERGGEYTEFDLQEELPKKASDKIKVQYLGFADAAPLQSDEANNFFAKKSSDSSLKDDLIGICNSIFQRSILPSDRLSGSELELDLSMRNLIVFVQGEDGKIISLTDENGKKIKPTLDSGQRKYSKISAGNIATPIQYDTTLAGQVVTFSNCPKGKYTLNYSSDTTPQIFYEPDVDMDVSIVNKDGKRVKKAEDFVADEYTISSKIIDRNTGEDVTNHELLGNNVKLNTYVKTSKDSSYKEYENGANINFEPDEDTKVYIEGKYLGKYKITSREDPNWKWLNLGIKIKLPKLTLELDAEQTWYTVKDHKEWKPIKAIVKNKGKPLTDDELKNTKLNIEVNDELKYRVEPILGESAFNIYVSQDESGKCIEPKTGKYKMYVTAIYENELGKSDPSNEEKVSFEIQTYPLIVRILLISGIILIILAILIAITIILHKIKVLPNDVISDNSVYKKAGKSAGVALARLNINSKGLFKQKGTISINTNKGNMGVSLSVESSHPLFRWPFQYQRPSKRKYKIVGISAAGMESVSIDGSKYTQSTFGDVSELGYDSSTIEYEKRVGGIKHSVRTDLVNK